MEELSGWVEEVVNSISSIFLSPLKTSVKKCIKTLERVKSQKVLSFFFFFFLLALFDTTKKTWLAALNGHEVHSACGHLKTVKSLF